MSTFSNDTISKIVSASHTWKDVMTIIINKLQSRISKYANLLGGLGGVTTIPQAEIQDFAVDDYIVRYGDLYTAIDQDLDVVECYDTTGETFEMNVNDVCQNLGDNLNASKILLAGLLAAGDESLESVSDRITVFNARIGDLATQLSGTAKDTADMIIQTISTNSLTIRDRVTSILEFFSPKSDEQPGSWTILQCDRNDYIYGSPISAAFGLVDVDWSTVSSAISGCCQLAYDTYQGFKVLLAKGIIWLVKQGAGLIRSRVTQGQIIRQNTSYEVFGNDCGYMNVNFHLPESAYDYMRPKMDEHPGCAMRIKTMGGDLYITNVSSSGDHFHPYTLVEAKFVGIIPGDVLTRNTSPLVGEANVSETLTELLEKYGIQGYITSPTAPELDFVNDSWANKFVIAMFCAPLIRFIHELVVLSYNDPDSSMIRGTTYYDGITMINSICGTNMTYNDVVGASDDPTISRAISFVSGTINTGMDPDDEGISNIPFVRGLQSLVTYCFGDRDESDTAFFYEWVTGTRPASYHILTNTELAEAFTSSISAVGKVAVTIITILVVGKITSSLKRKAAILSAQSDLYYFDDDFGGTAAEWKTWYKMTRAADRLSWLAGVGTNAIAKLVTAPGKIISAIKESGAKSSEITTSQRDILSGIKGNNDITISDIYRLIKRN